MRIAFIGDVHGRVFHCLAGLSVLPERRGQFDLLIQVGDFGYPDPANGDAATKIHLELDPAEAGVRDLMQATGQRAKALGQLRERLGPILFIRGNHEDFAWLKKLSGDAPSPVDPFDLFHYVADGSIIEVDGLCIAFLRGVEEQEDEAGIDMAAHRSLLRLGPGFIDLLITHEGPYGSSRGFRGDVHGSSLITKLIEATQPAYHVFGHAHQLLGPQLEGETTWLGLDGLVASPRWEPDAKGLRPGCFGVLDTRSGILEPVTDEWLTSFPTPFDFDAWVSP